MEPPPVFLCDAMLGGLARWLRAAGYEAEFDVHIEDGELVRRAHQENKVLLTSDGDIMDRFAVTEDLIDYVFIPRDLDVMEQLGHVLATMDIPLRNPRCMECGGELGDVDLEEVSDEVPPKVRRECTEYWRCGRCGKVYWRGTHWQSISERLDRAAEMGESLPDDSG